MQDNYVLENVILHYVAPNANLVTDMARAYHAFLKRAGITHKLKNFVVVHTQNFLNPSNKSLHTQNCDGRFGHLKIKKRSMHGVLKKNFQDHF